MAKSYKKAIRNFFSANANNAKSVASYGVHKALFHDPENWFKAHKSQLVFEAEQGAPPLAALCLPGPIPKSLEQPAGMPFKLEIRTGGGMDSINLGSAPSIFMDTGIRYLTWLPDHVTYTQMDPGARLFFTGPLSGCNIYVAGTKQNPWVFHTNKNDEGTDVKKNNMLKLTMTLGLLTHGVMGKGVAPVIGGSVTREAYSGKYLGFVFGNKATTDWEFFFYGNDGTTPYVKRLPF